LDAIYEFHFYNAGLVPWNTPRGDDGFMGGWGADHGGPSDTAVDPSGRDPRLWLAFSGQEGGSWLMTVDREGRKTGAESSTWNGGQFVAVDGTTLQPMLFYGRDEGEYPGNAAWKVKMARWAAPWPAPLLLGADSSPPTASTSAPCSATPGGTAA
jgi:hypothetical protein